MFHTHGISQPLPLNVAHPAQFRPTLGTCTACRGAVRYTPRCVASPAICRVYAICRGAVRRTACCGASLAICCVCVCVCVRVCKMEAVVRYILIQHRVQHHLKYAVRTEDSGVHVPVRLCVCPSIRLSVCLSVSPYRHIRSRCHSRTGPSSMLLFVSLSMRNVCTVAKRYAVKAGTGVIGTSRRCRCYSNHRRRRRCNSLHRRCC